MAVWVPCAAAAVLAGAPDARAAGALVSSPAGAAAATEVRVAVAGVSGRTARWESLHVQGPAARFAWVLPVRPGAYVDLASDAWMEALEAATAPRVVPPDVAPPCGVPGGVDLAGDASHHATTTPDGVAVAADRASLDATLASWGLAVTSDLAPGLDAAAAAGEEFALLVFTGGAADVRTRTVRVVDTGPPEVALGLTRGAAGGSAVTAYFFADAPTQLGAIAPLAVPPGVVWRSDGTSTYAGIVDALLQANPGEWLVDGAGHGALAGSTPVPGGESVPSLDAEYFDRAAAYGDATGSSATCAAGALASAADVSSVAPACAAGRLARIGVTAACTESAGSGEIDPGSLRCGGTSDDLALALSGLAPGATWVFRARTVVAASAFGADDGLVPAASEDAVGPVLTATGYDAACTPPGVDGGAGAGPGPSGGTAGASSSGAGGSGGGGVAPPDPGGGAAASVAAAASAASDSSDGCGGDTSDAPSDSCGGDSSSSSGDDSSGDSSGGGCDGSSSSGSDSSSGDSCGSGSSSSSGSSDCEAAGAIRAPRSPHGRSPTSRAVLLFAALAAVARRRAQPRSTK